MDKKGKNYKIIRLEFGAPLHIGNSEGMLEEVLMHIPSDVAFSAVCSVYRHIYGAKETEEMLKEYQRNPFFRISSFFPYCFDRYFLPCPLNIDLFSYGFDPKDARRVKYMDYEVFCLAIQGVLTTQTLADYKLVGGGSILAPRELKAEEFFQEQEITRVALDSITGAANVFHYSQLVFKEGAGLFGLVECEERFWPRLQTCWRVLGDEGLGGDRSCGKGWFKVDFAGEMAFPLVDKPRSHVLLSLYYPRHEETAAFDADYTLIRRAGYFYSPDENSLRRQSVTMLAEGSVIYSFLPVGTIVDVTPPLFNLHRVWRNGYAFSIASVLGKGGGV